MREVSNDRTPAKAKDEPVDFNYQADPPKPDLLDYRYMAIEMSRLSGPGKIWTSVLAGLLVMGLCVLMIWVERLLSYALSG
jgi:hypothetical protein